MIPDNLLDKVHCIDALALLKMLPDESVNCIVTSPPYFGLRNYQVDGQIGLEDTPRAFVDRLVTIFAEARRVLRNDGVIWVNMGDTYSGSSQTGGVTSKETGKRKDRMFNASKALTELPSKSRLGIPHRLVFALQDDGWIWRSEITWCKPSPMPESVTDRPTKATEKIFMLTKSPKYYYDADSTRVLANKLNSVYSIQKTGLEIGLGGSCSPDFTAQSSDVALYDNLAPYLVLSALFTTKGIFIKHGDNLFRKLLDILYSPPYGGIGFRFSRFMQLLTQSSTNGILYILQQISIVVAQDDLNSESELWIRLWSIPHSMPQDKTSFTIEQASEVISKIIANIQLLRNTISLDAFRKCSVDIDAINQSVALFQSSDFSSSDVTDISITEPLLEQINLGLSNFGIRENLPGVSHSVPFLDCDYPINYTPDKQSKQGHNLWDWWVVPAEPTPFAHFATFPQALIEPMILAGCPKDGVVLDPFMGSGTTAIVARRLGRHYIGSELNPEYAALANDRLLKDDAVILVEQKTCVSQMSMFELLD